MASKPFLGVVFDDIFPDERRGLFEFEALVARELGATVADFGERGGTAIFGQFELGGAQRSAI